MGTGHDSYAALRVAPFRSLIINRFCLTLALQIQAVVVGWQVYERTHDRVGAQLENVLNAAR